MIDEHIHKGDIIITGNKDYYHVYGVCDGVYVTLPLEKSILKDNYHLEEEDAPVMVFENIILDHFRPTNKEDILNIIKNKP